MGIEHIIVNFDKKELLDFDRLGFGTKIGSITSEPIASLLSWLLINPEGYGDAPPKMLGRWAGERIEIVGDEGAGSEKQDLARRECKDITIETISGYAEAMPFERITQLQPMGLIDKEGRVIINSQERKSVAAYWKTIDEQQSKELENFVAEASKVLETARNGTAEQVRGLRCPASGGSLRIEYFETKEEPPYIIVKGTASDFIERISKLACKPPWVEEAGRIFITTPERTEC